MKIPRLLVVIFFLLLIWLLGCSDEPNEVGIGILPPGDALRIDSLTARATFDTTFLARINGSSGTLLVGKYQNLEARTLLQFDNLSNLPTGARLDSASISFRTNYRFKDSTGELGFSAYKVLREWSPSTVIWDSITPSGTYDTLVGTFTSVVQPSDSVVNFKLDTAYVRQLLLNGKGSIILVPSITSRIVVGFSHTLSLFSDTRPELFIYFQDSTADTAKYRSSVGIFVANGDIPSSMNLLYLQSGIVYRSIIRFDSLDIPKKASVTQATLEVTIEQDSSLLNKYSRDSLLVFLLRKNSLPFDDIALGTICSPVMGGTQKINRADIRSIVQQWVTRGQNYGVVLRTFAEFTSLDRFALHGSRSATNLQPRLRITYTVLP